MNNTDKNQRIDKPQNVVIPENCVKKADRVFLHTEKEDDFISNNDGVV